MRSYSGILAGVLVVGIVGTTSAGAQTASRLGPSIPAIVAVVKGSSVAYDSRNSMYLVVSAYGSLNGRFVSAEGDLIGVPFTIQSGAFGATHFPGVAYSPDANGGAGGFLVAWHQSAAVGATVHARMVSSSGVVGPASQLTTDGSWWEAAVDVAYSTTSREFLVAWQAAGIRAQRVGLNGEALAPNIFVTGTDYHRDPSVAYNSTTNEFMVVYAGADALGAYVAARRVAAGSGLLPGTETLLNRSVGTYITEVAYNPTTNRYLASWYQGGTFGRLLDAAGSIVSDVLLLSSRFTSYDGLGLEYNTSSGTFMLVSQDSISYQNGAVELSGAGAVPGVGFVATDTATTVGNFYPKIAARIGKGEWLLSTATGFAATTVQRLQSTASGVPPCVVTPAVTSVSLLSAAVTFPIDVIAATTCRWTATSGASWLQVSSGGSATGSASVGVTALRNTTRAARSGTVTINGSTVTVEQAGFSAAAVHDINGDGGSDLLWQHQTTGELGTWYLNGQVVVGTHVLSIRMVSDTNWKVVGTGDLNGDGYADVVWRHTLGYIAAWTLRGFTVLTTQFLSIPVVADPGWKIRAVGDLNGDGKADIVWQHDTLGTLAVWLMDGALVQHTLLLSVSRMPDPNWQIAGAGDINSDGKADLIWQNQATGGLAAWLMNGAAVGEQRSLSANAIPNWNVVGVGDVNGDSCADLLWQSTTGGLAVWYLNGFNVVFQGFLSIDHVDDTNWKVVGPG